MAYISEIAISYVISIIGIILSVVSVFISFYTAKKYGDVAGTVKTIKYEQKKAAERRISALQSLMNEYTGN